MSGLEILLTDIDGTLTKEGALPARSYDRLEKLRDAGFYVIPVTGRPAGWCELIARLWPVHGVIGENGAFYFRFDGKKMRRYFVRPRAERVADRKKLKAIRQDVRKEVPGAGIASDQFCRLCDLAIDFKEDVQPLAKPQIKRIVDIFHRHGATAKISNIHVNGWFGNHDKTSTCRLYLKKEFGLSDEQMKDKCVFIGDSPNDEPMFEFFTHSFAVANIKDFLPELKSLPSSIAKRAEADGFCEVADQLLTLKVR